MKVIQANKTYVEHLEQMLRSGLKAEIEVLDEIEFNYLSEKYIDRKLRTCSQFWKR